MACLTTARRTVALVLAAAALSSCGDSGSDAAVATPSPSPLATATGTPTPTTTATATATPAGALELSGGETTVHDATRAAFSLPAANLDGERLTQFFVGNAIFNRNWVTAPASTEGLDGLGPTFNARSCSACHFRDGRGAPPENPEESPVGLLVRLSLPGVGEHGGVVADPAYGDQLQPQAILGVPAEGDVRITYVEEAGTFADGETYSLRRPTYYFVELAYGPMPPDLLTSPRVAPALIGLGLLAAVPEATLMTLAEDQARLSGGVSGRVNRVWNVRQQGPTLGRFGWKANQPTLEQQNAGAFVGDIGITSELFPASNCTERQPQCAAAIDGGHPEVDRGKLDAVTLYTHLLAVPARRDVDDPVVRRGEALFTTAGCASCHVQTLVTGALDGFPEVSGQVIHPYSDLLLHDLGADLADGRPDFLADGFEWRTPPLWGIGLVGTVNRHQNFLHDGRARGLMEAILWHGGEATAAREAVRKMDRADRAALTRFLESL